MSLLANTQPTWETKSDVDSECQFQFVPDEQFSGCFPPLGRLSWVFILAAPEAATTSRRVPMKPLSLNS